MGRAKTIDDQQLLSRARQVFREGGHAASTRDVARAAGISQAVLYQRFGSKDELFFRAMTPESPDIDSLLGPYRPRSARADLGKIARRLADYLRALVPTLLHVLASPDLGHDRLLKLHEGLAFHPLLAALTDRLKRMRRDRLIGDVHPQASARAFLGVIHSAVLAEIMTHGRALDDHSDMEALVDVLWSGFAPTRRRARRPVGRSKSAL